MFENNELKIIGKCHVTGLYKRTKAEWSYSNSEYSIKPYVIGDGSIIIINSKGQPSMETIKAGIDIFIKIQKEFKDIDGFVLISDQKNVLPLPQGARRVYIDFIKDNPRIKGAIFYNVNAVTKISMRIGKALNISNIVVTSENSYEDSVYTALKILNKEYILGKRISFNKLKLKVKNVKSKYIKKIKSKINLAYFKIEEELDFLNEFLLNIDWKSDEEEFDVSRFNKSPLRLIYETIIYIKSDLHSLIKERDKQKAQLEELNKSLEKKVMERTKELKEMNDDLLKEIEKRKLTEKSLIKAKELAEEANKSKSLFLANITHELKTPLNSILGYSSVAIKKGDKISKEKAMDYFLKINKSGKRLLSLLDDLINLSRLESTDTEYYFEDTDISEIITSAIDDIEYRAKEKNITIYYLKDHENVKIKLDKNRIRQVMDNILVNAVKFTYKNKEIEISSEIYDDKFIINFKDEGPGIENSEVFKIFNNFYQGVRTDNTFGSGLGLAISKNIVKAHGGKIWAKNRSDGVSGAVFTVELPLK